MNVSQKRTEIQEQLENRMGVFLFKKKNRYFLGNRQVVSGKKEFFLFVSALFVFFKRI